jgi:hypothetical protein
MKNKLLYLLPLSLALFASCGPGVSNPAPVNVPEGTFTGSFALLHTNTKTGLNDTSHQVTGIILSMQAATGFKITGDTTTYQAGSYGGFLVNEPTLQVVFYDKTFPATGTPAKIHLDGTYNYTYDGTNLEMGAWGAQDTLEYLYKFTKTGN